MMTKSFTEKCDLILSGQQSSNIVLHRNCLYSYILWISLRTLAKFQPKNYKVSPNLGKNGNQRQNTANLNISHIFGSTGYIFKKIWLGSLYCRV